MFRQTRLRLTVFYAAIMAAFFVLTVFGTYRAMRWSITSEQKYEVLLFAEEEAHEHAVLFKHGAALGDQADYKDGSGRMYFYAFDASGVLKGAAKAAPEVEAKILARIAAWDAPPGEVVKLFVDEDDEDEVLLMAAMPIVVDGETRGMVYVGRDVAAIYRALHKSLFVLAGAALAAFLLATLAGYAMAGRAIAPLRTAYEKQRQFAADASHELRTPLSVVMSSAEVLENECAQKSPLAAQLFADMKDEIRRMAKLVSDLLLLAKSDNQAIALRKEPFDLAQAAVQVVRRLQPLAEERRIRLFFAESALEMRGDAARVQQLLLILLDNAIKYTPEGGVVTLKLDAAQARKVEIAVTDTGPGIPESERAKVFDRFYRVDKARSRASGGAGLGLAIAREIVALHGGEIWAEGAPGGGSVFRAVLPR